MADSSSIDPRLQILPPGQTDGDRNEATTRKRQKLNLYKCNQCRIARKKCFPADRDWPGQKCERCLQHKPEELPCSEPQLNTRKRGPNKSAPRAKTRSSSEQTAVPAKDSDDESSSDEAPERPARIGLPKRIKREHLNTLLETPQLTPVGKRDQPPASAYKPLSDNEFRLLCLRPGRRDDMVVCYFETARIDNPGEYEAISYYWGGSDPAWQDSAEIELVDPQGSVGIHAVFIRNNLCNALKTLRHPSKVRNFWVDALCINRSDSGETNHQVLMKIHIFYKAKNQCLWLGDDETFKAGLSFITQILELGKIDLLVQVAKENSLDGWSAFVALLKCVIFSRLWIAIEVTVARNTTLHCGQQAIQYADFVDAVTMFDSCQGDVVRLFRRCKRDYLELIDRKINVTKRFVDMTQNTLRKLHPERPDPQIERRLSLESLVSLSSELTCTDGRDRIYAVIALAKDGLPPPEWMIMQHSSLLDTSHTLRIDYVRPFLNVSQDFVIHSITQSQSLDIICRCWAAAVTERGPILPTWVRPLQSGLQPPLNTKSSERTHADSLVGLPGSRSYNASGSSFALWSKVQYSSNLQASLGLKVKGFQVDIVTQLGPRASEGIIHYEWLELGGCVLSDNGDFVPENFWRILVGDRGPHRSAAPSWYHRALLYCLNRSQGRDINTSKLIKEFEATSVLVVEFLRRVQSVIWNRKLLVCSAGTWMGLAPMAAQVDDVVCVLYGCTVPVLLRPHPSRSNVEYWSLVGECYVHGIMDGEAVDMTKKVSEDMDFLLI